MDHREPDLEHAYAISPPSYQVLSDSQILATVPASFGGTVDVRVHNACGTSAVQSGDRFSYVYPADQCVSGSCSVAITSTPVGSLGHVSRCCEQFRSRFAAAACKRDRLRALLSSDI